MADSKDSSVTVECPCCGARLTVDTGLGKVVNYEAKASDRTKAPNLDQVDALLREQAARREAIFKQSAQDLGTKSQLLERKFQEGLKKTKDQPVTKPLRDFDLE